MIKGDRSEVTKFVRATPLWIYNMVYSFLLNKEETEEVVQDTILAALKGIGQFKNEASLKTWLYKIGMNKAKDLLKYKARQKRSGRMSNIDDVVLADKMHPGIALESKEEVAMILTAVDKLPENQKIALVLAKFDHKSYNEIGAILDLSSKAVESLVSRAKVNFRKQLEQL